TGTVAPAAAAGSAGNASTKLAPKKRPVDAYVPPQDDALARKAEPAPAQARPPTAAAAPSLKSGLEQ
ncbi:MAG: 2-oxoglutarate dehydrogenase, E2 component, dihydrolipoamide succinyltransferase, partial [Pseudomonadota bacterium]